MSAHLEIAGSGSLRVTTRRDVERAVVARTETIIETDRFQTQVDDFWAALRGYGFSPQMIERIWVANRCSQLNCQQIRSMPLRFHGSFEPAWVANPDPVWYPNGIGDAVFSAMWSLYNFGDAVLYVESEYATGYPQGWTVVEPSSLSIELRKGKRVYKSGNYELDPDRVCHISRDPRGLRGTSALRSFAGQVHGLLAAQDSGRSMMTTGMPNAVLKSHKKLDEAQATKLQDAWVSKTSVRRGAPAVLPPDVDFQQLSFSVSDLMLLESQNFDAKAIAAAYGVPPMMVNLSYEGFTYQSAGSLGEHWWRFELRPMAGALASALSAQMLPAGSYVEFDARETLAP